MSFTPRDVLAKNRLDAQKLVQRVGTVKTRKVMEAAERDLVARLRTAVSGPGDKSFTAVQLQATLKQVRAVLKDVNGGLKKVMVEGSSDVADKASEGVVEYLTKADDMFRGVGSQPLAIHEASMLDNARSGAQSSLLRRLASSGEPVEGADEKPHPAKIGVLDRYGMNVIGHFEDTLQRGLISRKPWDAIRGDLIEKSPFLQQAPASWAERIVRTEMMGAYNRAGWEGMREADEQLGDMIKILSATFDNRTAADSYAVHGQIRRVDEAFETWYGLMQHPPARPNDREIVVPHRISWVIPPYLQPKNRGEVAARWHLEKRKGAMPGIPLMTTVPLSQFGKQQERKTKRKDDDGGNIAKPEQD